MIKLINNYTYRFKHPKRVYCITNNRPLSSSAQKTFLSVPFISSDQKIETNVLIAFSDKLLCDDHVNSLNQVDCIHAHSFEIDIDDFRYMGKQISLPIAIILEKKADIYDIRIDFLRYGTDNFTISS